MWVAIPFSRGFFWPGGRTWVSCIAGRFFTIWATREALIWTLGDVKMETIYSTILTAYKKKIYNCKGLSEDISVTGLTLFICTGTSVILCQSPFPRDSQMRDCKKQGGLRHLKACLFHVLRHPCEVMGGRESSRDVIFEEPYPIISFHSLNMRPQGKPINLSWSQMNSW